ncbi:hypothetical protein QQF64_007561 [Cirrhinus molitorella]|uniref:Ig-like domain-containing protein n=1 Tax=Cirrhinus molitorella TaxID=172907 RepID=A0ABR3MB49_9TELE
MSPTVSAVYQSDSQRQRKCKKRSDESTEPDQHLPGHDLFSSSVFVLVIDRLVAELDRRFSSYDTKQLKETQKTFQQRIQQREKDVQQLREAVESHKKSFDIDSLVLTVICPCPGETIAPVTSTLTSAVTNSTHTSECVCSVSVEYVLVWCFQLMVLLGLLGGFHIYMRHTSGSSVTEAASHSSAGIVLFWKLDFREIMLIFGLMLQLLQTHALKTLHETQSGSLLLGLVSSRKLDFREMMLIFGLMLLQTAACLDRFCRFDQSEPCYAALEHKLNLQMMLDAGEYDLKLIKIINNRHDDPICRVKNDNIKECDLYKNGTEATVTNGTLIIKHVIRADSGNYRLEHYDGGRETSRDLQVIVEAPIGSVEVSIICSSSGVMHVSCSSEGDQLLYSWTLNGDPLMDGNSSIDLNEGNDGNISCSVKNHVSHMQKTIRVKPCPGELLIHD